MRIITNLYLLGLSLSTRLFILRSFFSPLCPVPFLRRATALLPQSSKQRVPVLQKSPVRKEHKKDDRPKSIAFCFEKEGFLGFLRMISGFLTEEELNIVLDGADTCNAEVLDQHVCDIR